MARRHFLEPQRIHFRWDNTLPPALTIDSGDTVVFDLQENSTGQITPASTASAVARLDRDRTYPLGGPLSVRDAEPGDTLEVEILRFQPAAWGWTAVMPGFGVLSDELAGPYLVHWDLSNRRVATGLPSVAVPIEPFCGVMGVAPEEPGSFHPTPPGKFGGNMDIRHLTVDTTLLLPVWVPGALFSCGDCHSAQGDGEVCGFGIETSMRVTLRFRLWKGLQLTSPQFVTPNGLTPRSDRRGYHVTTGIRPDLMEATREAIRQMLTHLTQTYGLSRMDAYVLCSVAVDLKISEVVDRPNWIVSAYLPRHILRRPRAGAGPLSR